MAAVSGPMRGGRPSWPCPDSATPLLSGTRHNEPVGRQRGAQVLAAGAFVVAVAGFGATEYLNGSGPGVVPPSPYASPGAPPDCSEPEADPVRCAGGGECPDAGAVEPVPAVSPSSAAGEGWAADRLSQTYCAVLVTEAETVEP